MPYLIPRPASVVLDGDGNGTVSFGIDNSNQRWIIDEVAVQTDQAQTAAPVPVCIFRTGHRPDHPLRRRHPVRHVGRRHPGHHGNRHHRRHLHPGRRRAGRLTMALKFGNPIVAGTVLTIPAIQSTNWPAGGWIIRADGSAVFQSITIPPGSGGARVFYGPTEPMSPNPGDVWFDKAERVEEFVERRFGLPA